MSMKIIHRYSPGIPFLCSKKSGADPLSGVFGLIGTEMTNETNEGISNDQLVAQQIENQKNRDYNTAEAEKARQFEANQAQLARQFTTSERLAQQQYQSDQWQFQLKNQLPMMMHAAKISGLNPNVAASHVISAGGGSVAAPSGASSPIAGGHPAQFSGGLSPVPYQAVNPVTAFATAAQGLSSLATAKEKGANVNLIEKQVENMAVDTEYKKVLMDGAKILNDLNKLDLSYKEKKLVKEIALLSAQVAMYTSQGKLFDRQTQLQDSIEELNYSLSEKNTQEAFYTAARIGTYTREINSLIALNAAKTKEANENAFKLGEEAKLTKLNAESAKAIAPYLTQIKRAEAYVSQASAPWLIKEQEEKVKHEQWFNELLQNEILLKKIETMDKSVYNAFQRLIHGKTIDGDVKTLLGALTNIGQTEYMK